MAIHLNNDDSKKLPISEELYSRISDFYTNHQFSFEQSLQFLVDQNLQLVKPAQVCCNECGGKIVTCTTCHQTFDCGYVTYQMYTVIDDQGTEVPDWDLEYYICYACCLNDEVCDPFTHPEVEDAFFVSKVPPKNDTWKNNLNNE